ncbi:hypothetical protein EVJ58_g8956 [Rhodofomes roseus]|uniref:Reverse transcriptase domain-containing protein n=1 Tax=Rhodofomes roseus TaxID=34475 RepID=A0A4Y9XVX3_9APHY|nr:hypothetical protein EVJ58_g8956 [Rhodofomes roseus]
MGATDGGQARIPDLKKPDGSGTVLGNVEKSKILYDTFFPPECPPPDIPPDHQHPPPLFSTRPVTDAQIHDTIRRLQPWRAPGPDGIPNDVYRHCADLLVPVLGPLYRATFELRYFPAVWKEAKTVVLRKPGRDDYQLPGSYRPIALMNCMGKILSACVIESLKYELEARGILPNTHFGGRPGRSATDALMQLVTTVRDAWRDGLKASTLFLDVKAAFPSASPEQLFHDMREMGIPEDLVDWYRRKMDGRTTVLLFDDYQSETFVLRRGINQGDADSGDLYIIYNSPLLKHEIVRVTSSGFIDDVSVTAVGKTFRRTHQLLRKYMEDKRTGGALRWSTTRHSAFEMLNFNCFGCYHTG